MSNIPAGFKQTEVGVIPEDWEVKKLGDVVKISSGESPSRFKFTDDGTPYFKVEQLNNGNKYLIETPYHSKFKTTVHGGSIIFPKRGASILLNKIRILVEDSFMDTNLMTLTLSDELNNEFFYYALLHKELWRIADTNAIPQINNKHINP
ncbi:MAG: restriction endonuclease subunit S, partial [Planctomycetes bacterium]|nr:restriction endonuclease subunit S [Planctomycetota bacterium]